MFVLDKKNYYISAFRPFSFSVIIMCRLLSQLMICRGCYRLNVITYVDKICHDKNFVNESRLKKSSIYALEALITGWFCPNSDCLGAVIRVLMIAARKWTTKKSNRTKSTRWIPYTAVK